MHSNYNPYASNNIIRNNNNNNNNHDNYHNYKYAGKDFCCIIDGTKFLGLDTPADVFAPYGPFASSQTLSSPAASPPPPAPNAAEDSPTYSKSCYQTDTKFTTDAQRYCNMFPQSTFDKKFEYAQHPQQIQPQRQDHAQGVQHKRNHQSRQYNHTHVSPSKLSPLAAVHRNATSTARNYRKIQELQQHHAPMQKIPQQRLEPRSGSGTGQPQQSESHLKNYSTEQHYNHYFSYYYNSEARLSNPKQQGRHTLIAPPQNTNSAINPILMPAEKTKAHLNRAWMRSDQLERHRKIPGAEYVTRTLSELDNYPALYQHVLKEKMPNNNVISGYDNARWLQEVDEAAIVNPDDLCDVKDIMYEPESDQKTAGGDVLQSSKRKLRTLSDSEAQALTQKANQAHSWNGATRIYEQIPLGLKEDDIDVGSDNAIPVHYTVAKFQNKSKVKKQSPPVHRVLHYGNQSPRLARFGVTGRGERETRRQGFNYSPALNAKVRVLPHSHRQGAHAEKPHLQGGPQVLRISRKPLENNKKDNDESALLQKHRQKGGADNNNDNNDSENDDDDDKDDDDQDNKDGYSTDDDAADSDDLDADSPVSSDGEISTDSEDGYRESAYRMTHSLEASSGTRTMTLSSETSMKNPDSVLVPSLFPNVPPYLAFSTSTAKGPRVPPELYRVLKWRISNVMPKVVRLVLVNSGMRLLKKTNDWMGVWGKHMKSPGFKTIRPYQKMNHLPGSFKIGRKDSCWKNLQKQMAKHGKKDFGFMPKTYIIPHDLNLLRKHWPNYAQRNYKWIIKPPASARGTGIRVVDSWQQIPKRRPLIVQRYIERPLLINGSKFDLRLYVLVTSVNPLRVYMYHDGLARFAAVKYSDRSDTLNDRCMHLTNYSINKLSANYAKNDDVNACNGHKWTIKSLWSYLSSRGIRTNLLWEALRNLVLRTLLSGEQSINSMIKINVESKYSCFELFGFDVLLDADLIPWLLEVNISPSLHSELPLDAHVKAPLVQAVLNTALYNIPPKLSLEKQKEIATDLGLPYNGPICYDKRLYVNYISRSEKIKHCMFTSKTVEDRDAYLDSILHNLTPDDVRCLIVAEDELARSAPLERIFPTTETYKYLKYTEHPRYYNRLLDAWEARYGNDRALGIEILRKYCEQGYHLEVPPAPVKKPLKYRPRAIMVRRATGATMAAASFCIRWRSRRLINRAHHRQRRSSAMSNCSWKEETAMPHGQRTS